MSDDVIYCVMCNECGKLCTIETVATQWIDGRAVAWEHRCATCGTRFGVTLDGGTLDLGMVKEGITQDINNVEIFTEEPWRS